MGLETRGGPHGIMPVGFLRPEHQAYVGKRLDEIAEVRGQDWIEAALDLLVAEGQRISTFFFSMDEANLRLQVQQPWIKFSTDAGGHDPAWAKARGPVHPRGYGTYPRVLRKYVREERLLTLEEAVRKMTSSVADRLSLRDRGPAARGASSPTSSCSTPRRSATAPPSTTRTSSRWASATCGSTGAGAAGRRPHGRDARALREGPGCGAAEDVTPSSAADGTGGPQTSLRQGTLRARSGRRRPRTLRGQARGRSAAPPPAPPGPPRRRRTAASPRRRAAAATRRPPCGASRVVDRQQPVQARQRLRHVADVGGAGAGVDVDRRRRAARRAAWRSKAASSGGLKRISR
jgi:hypothetical protein